MQEKKWKISLVQKGILDSLLQNIDINEIKRVLDVGSGRTSIHYLADKFKHVKIKGIVYPGDERKIKPIKECVSENNYEIVEIDLKNLDIVEEFDLILAHLFLGEAEQFGDNKFKNMLKSLFSIKTRYLAIVNLLYTDTAVDYRLLLKYIAKKGSIKKIIHERSEEGEECIGLLIEKNHD